MIPPFHPDRPPSSPYRAYLEESRAPLACLFVALIFLVPYHVGVYIISKANEIPWANGADVLIAAAMKKLGLGGPLVSLCVIVIAFLFLHQIRNRPWRFPRLGTLSLMLLEGLVFALPPFLLGKVVHAVLMSAGAAPQLRPEINMVLSLGAGVYEEFLFRMLLLGGLLLLFRRIWPEKPMRAAVVAILIQAVLFALFHHLPGGGAELSLPMLATPSFLRKFAFRTLAGVYFAYLYRERGFGIAAGSHAFYDLIAVMLNAFR